MIDPRRPASLSAADILRVSAAVRFAERFDRARGNGAGRAPGGTNPDGPAVWPLKVTGTSGGGFQPARLQFWPGETSLADLADARAGTLTTRTDNDTGVVTFAAGHGFATNDKIDLKWLGGVREAMTATVMGIVVAVEGGTGDNLPVAMTAVTATTDDVWILLTGDQSFEAGDRTLGVVIGMKEEDGRPVFAVAAGAPGPPGPPGSGGAGFPVRVTAIGAGPSVTWRRIRWVSGTTWADDSTSPATGTAYLIRFPADTTWTAAVGDRGTVYQSGTPYYFIPEHGEATATHRGLMSTGTQTFAGAKTFTGLVVAAGLQSTTGGFVAYSGATTTMSLATTLFQIGDSVNGYIPNSYVYTNALLIESDPTAPSGYLSIIAKGVSSTLLLGSNNGHAWLFSPIVYISDSNVAAGLEIKCNSPAANDLTVRWNVPGGLGPADRFKYAASSTRWTFYGTFESDTKFRCAGNDGLTTTQTFKDEAGVTKTMTIIGGIVTGIA